MALTKLTNGNKHRSSVTHAPEGVGKNQKDAARSNRGAALRKKTEPADTEPGQQPRKKTERMPKAENLVCRYCGSDDLAPSFIKRRDRRCRKCFAKKYGSDARTKKAPLNK